MHTKAKVTAETAREGRKSAEVAVVSPPPRPGDTLGRERGRSDRRRATYDDACKGAGTVRLVICVHARRQLCYVESRLCHASHSRAAWRHRRWLRLKRACEMDRGLRGLAPLSFLRHLKCPASCSLSSHACTHSLPPIPLVPYTNSESGLHGLSPARSRCFHAFSIKIPCIQHPMSQPSQTPYVYETAYKRGIYHPSALS
ncbi:hypothetical protein K458DRAFT_138544 [Lentithecium fluviatile CBS 122367]|uniref:Uncharacterized protein n=1 Tax=Lentithecium fluviatile CBS 122367 TaxID=1168545 RepID=A0A6G1IK97_9PLEO|nr:hypothetical protein K458DRAFT_138544 [Lentithecium fluviatile CBS 122367]